MKKLLALVLTILLLLCSGVGAYATDDIPEETTPDNSSSTPAPGDTIPDDSAMNFEEARAKGIPYDKPLHEKTRQELLRDGYQFYGGTTPLSPFRASTASVLGYITAAGKTPIYSGPGTGANLGYVTFREIVYISSISGSFAYVQFKNDKGVLTFGHIPNGAVYSPSLGWATPITSGKVTQYYGEKVTDPNGHSGTDIGGHSGGTPAVYAAFTGTATFTETTKTIKDGTKYFANYGKHIRLKSGAYDVNYAHLSSFAYSVSSNNYSSEGYPVPEFLSKIEPVSEVRATKNVTRGSTIGNVGTTGQSTGNHLHLEVRINGTLKDPFGYVVFPNVSWAK